MVTIQLQRRRKGSLELLSLVIPISSAVFMSGVVINDWTRLTSALVAGSVALAIIVAFSAYRVKHPADVTAAAPEAAPEVSPEAVEDQDDGRWDLFTLALMGFGIVAIVTIGLLVQFTIPLTMIFIFAGFSSASVSEVAVVIAVTLAIAFVLEFAISLPLSKRWGLPID